MLSLQEQYAPNNQCFGCGPKNDQGLQIKSFVEGNHVIAHFTPKLYHQAFDNILNGGICGALLDCHSNWCAAYNIMKFRNLSSPPCTVTASYKVTLLAPTPLKSMLTLIARCESVNEKKAIINADIIADDRITAQCQGVFIAVNEGHPAFHRW